MIPYMDLNEQVDADFTRARRRARLRATVARIRREHASNRLLSFDDVRRQLLVADNRLYRGMRDRKSTRLNSSHANISYAVFCLKKKKHSSTLSPLPSCSPLLFANALYLDRHLP